MSTNAVRMLEAQMSDFNQNREAPMPVTLEDAIKEIRRLRHIVSLDIDAQMAKRFEKLCLNIKSLRGELKTALKTHAATLAELTTLKEELEGWKPHIEEMVGVRNTLSPIGVELGHAPDLIRSLQHERDNAIALAEGDRARYEQERRAFVAQSEGLVRERDEARNDAAKATVWVQRQVARAREEQREADTAAFRRATAGACDVCRANIALSVDSTPLDATPQKDRIAVLEGTLGKIAATEDDNDTSDEILLAYCCRLARVALGKEVRALPLADRIAVLEGALREGRTGARSVRTTVLLSAGSLSHGGDTERIIVELERAAERIATWLVAVEKTLA